MLILFRFIYITFSFQSFIRRIYLYFRFGERKKKPSDNAVIGGWNNTRTIVRRGSDKVLLDARTENVLSHDEPVKIQIEISSKYYQQYETVLFVAVILA